MRGRAQTGDDLSDLALMLSAWGERGSQGISFVVAFGPVVVLELHMSLSRAEARGGWGKVKGRARGRGRWLSQRQSKRVFNQQEAGRGYERER